MRLQFGLVVGATRCVPNNILLHECCPLLLGLLNAPDTLSITRDTKIFSQTLEEAGDDPSPHNQSSIMFLFKPSDGKIFLFTGDAGIAAFENIRYPEDVEKIQNVYWLKVPHHGSKKNLNNKWLNHIHPQVAYISTEKYTHYMSKAVVNALNKFNCSVYATNDGSNYWHHCETPNRQDYHTATALE